MSKGRIRVGATVMLLVVAAAVTAHHGTLINYDRSKQWTAKVVVTEFRYVNPHAQLFFDRRKDDGSVEHFNGELLPNPAQLVRNGWSRKRAVERRLSRSTMRRASSRYESASPACSTRAPSRR